MLHFRYKNFAYIHIHIVNVALQDIASKFKDNFNKRLTDLSEKNVISHNIKKKYIVFILLQIEFLIS